MAESPPPLEGAVATSTFPLRLLAPAARGVPGGLIKFDLLFPLKDHPPPPLLPAASFSHPPQPWGVFQAGSRAPRGQTAGKARVGDWGCSSRCGAVGGGCPRRLPRCSGSKFTREVWAPAPPSPLLPRSEGLHRLGKNVLIFLPGEVVLARNGLLPGGERGVRQALFICRINRK